MRGASGWILTGSFAAAVVAVLAWQRGELSALAAEAAAARAQHEELSRVREERRRELFLEGHRLYDTIRFNLPLVPAAGAVFPNGGGTYGNNKCLPLPDVERLNNPSIIG